MLNFFRKHLDEVKFYVNKIKVWETFDGVTPAYRQAGACGCIVLNSKNDVPFF